MKCINLRKASMTVEAALVVPFFLFFFMNVLTAFDILRLQSNITAAMHQTGNRIAIHRFEAVYAEDVIAGVATAMDSSASESDNAEHGNPVYNTLLDAASVMYAQLAVVDYLGTDYLDHSPVVGGSGGLSFVASEISGEHEIVDLVCTYQVKPLFGLVSFSPFRMENRYFGHAWVGYEGGFRQKKKGKVEEETVYITETGRAYHRSRSCTYLDLSIFQTTLSAARLDRNKSGAIYHPCEHCGGKPTEGDTVYTTDYGNRYHNSLNCSGLKRTITEIPLSKVGGRHACSKCGGK